MTRVDFYVIDNPDERQHQHLVCRLTERAWREGHGVHIHCDEMSLAETLDDLLWTYKDTSFLPHARLGADAARNVKITLGAGSQMPDSHDVLLNLCHAVPGFFSRFNRVMETTGADPTTRDAARHRYRFYQERGYTLNTHKLGQ